jgi:sterol desaturase/sphingolipid hydroxylase (fatty acid hydroxylase superfamily)
MPSFHYPVVVGGAFALMYGLLAIGAPLAAATYVPIVAAGLVVAWLERVAPARLQWEPTDADLRTDAAYLTVVQLGVPPVVGLVFAGLLVEPARRLHLPLASLWPHAWPIWAQTVTMILAVDFLRYWLHRAAHQWDVLWRLHAVHHSVDRLYFLNTSRFHPLEKGLQMCLDSLPFLLMGVDASVLAGYYVAYSTNGFCQHCNVAVRYGVLNYVVGSAETHRWHHSREPGEANANYGNTVIVWDLLFGTWFLPANRTVRDLGLHDRSFPKTFWAQMRVPFTRR